MTAPSSPPTLRDLLEEEFCLLALLKGGAWPAEAEGFHGRLQALLAAFERRALDQGKGPGSVEGAKYAWCALADELLLGPESPLRAAWEREPLQLLIFGDHLAGEGFFRRLDILRRDPAAHRETLEVFHACLALGFQGRYRLEDPQRVQELIGEVGRELARVRGQGPAWSRAVPPSGFPAPLGPALPLKALAAASCVAALTLFASFRLILSYRAQEVAVKAGPLAPAP